MSDVDSGGATASAEAVSEPAPLDDVVTPPEPIRDDPMEKEPEPEAKKDDKPLTTREALRKAVNKVEADNKTSRPKPPEAEPPKEAGEAVKADAKPPTEPAKAEETVKTDPPKPAPSDVPARFSAQAKEHWNNTPEPVRQETQRALRELEKGIEGHRAEIEPIKDYIAQAKQYGTTVKQALDNYTGLERLIRSDPIKGLETVAQYAGLSLRDVAAQIMGQTPDQNQSQSDSVIRELRQQLSQVQQQMTGVTTHLQSQRQQTVEHSVTEFAQSHPRFDELASDIKFFIESGRTNDLGEAYQLAERLNPASPSSIQAPAPVDIKPDLSAQTLKGSKSLSGSPSPGSDPAAKRKPSQSIRDSLLKAMSAAG